MIALEINLSRIVENICEIRRRVAAELIAVVKADAYGHGSALCPFIERYVDGFAVSSLGEAEELRAEGVTKRILILAPSEPSKIHGGITYTVCSVSDLRRFKSGAEIAVKINSGMNRLGADVSEVAEIAKFAADKNLKITQAFTHFCCEESAAAQFANFMRATRGFDFKKHCCASNCLDLPSSYHLDAVRCGLAIYGYGEPYLKPVMSAYTYVVQVNCVHRGERIGYGDFTACRDMKIAVLQAGYADGYRRADKNEAIINGVCVPIVGLVCMDMCMADVTGVPVKRGDKAYLLGDELDACRIAENRGTVPYEVLTSFRGKRIRRVYE